jgi:hypothetical protein
MIRHNSYRRVPWYHRYSFIKLDRMSHFYLLLEFAKVFNWTDRIVEVRVVAGWPTTGDAPLLDKKIRG